MKMVKTIFFFWYKCCESCCFMEKRTRFLLLILPLISSFFFLSKFHISKNFISLFSGTERHTKLKLDTHMGKWLIYCVHQKQAARIYLFLYFSSFFFCLQLAKIKNLLLQIVSTYLWWLWPGVCELCSLSAIFVYIFSLPLCSITYSGMLGFSSNNVMIGMEPI